MAIDVNELRIGNYIMLGDKPERVYSIIYDRNKGYAINHENYLADWYEPIVITEDFLNKNSTWNESIGRWVFYWGNTGSLFVRRAPEYNAFAVELGSGLVKIIFNVHRWQNLFYEISDTELKLTF